MKEYEGENLILVGDFNSVMNNDLDVIAGNPHTLREITAFHALVNESGLTDVWRLQHEAERNYTWSRTNPFVARRLDYCFVDENSIANCFSCDIVSLPNTDHRGVKLEISNMTFNRGPGYWKFNNSLLDDHLFVESTNCLLDETLSDNHYDNNTDKWEYVKVRIREHCIGYSRCRSLCNLNKIVNLQRKLEDTERELAKNHNEELVKEMVSIKKEFELVSEDKAKGAQTRARIKWIEEGEKNTKYFLSLEKSRAQKRIITQLKTDNGDVITGQERIMKGRIRHFSSLCNQATESDNENIKEVVEDFLDGADFPKLDEDESRACDGSITVSEAGAALRTMKNGSAPGSDGLTVEFVKYF